MKKNEKAKKVTATKKITTTAKTATKTVKKAARPAVKTAAKAKKPAITAKTAAKKPAAKKAAAPAKAVKAPAKTEAKTQKATKQTIKTPAKAAAKKAATVKAVKAAPKKAEKAPAKAPKTQKVTKQTIKTTPKIATTKPVAAKSAAKPIMVKMPQNQNAPIVSGVGKPVVMMAPQKSAAAASATNPNMVKPVYRPIQVINKPLAPVQPVRQMAPIAKEAEKVEFKKGDYVCYPAHGVGEIEAVETQTIGGMEIKLYAIAFEKDRMRLKVPVAKAHASGLRRLSSTGRMEDALKTLQGRAHVRRAMWSRRAQEYETKINSGDPVSIAEVLRDLKRSNDDSEQSYSERQIYQSALERLAREVAAVEKISEEAAAERLENMIKGRKARAASEKGTGEKKEAVA